MNKKELADKICDLHAAFLDYSLENPAVLDDIPDRAILVFLDDGDPAFGEKNKRLCEETRRLQEKAGGMVSPLVYITMRRAKESKTVAVIGVRTDKEISPSPTLQTA